MGMIAHNTQWDNKYPNQEIILKDLKIKPISWRKKIMKLLEE